jgi:uncharacterized protein (TIGR04255 family)
MPEPLPARHYPNAPITEAVIDLRVELPPNAQVETLDKVQEGEEETYPVKQPLYLDRLQVAPGFTASAVRHQVGFRFQSKDEKYIFQARLDGFTMSRFPPYEDWERFQAESQRLWSVYRRVARPTKVVRLAVRYLNRLDLPLPVSNFEDYLRTVPQVPAKLPQGLAGYFMQLKMPMESIKSMALINEGIIEEAVRPDAVSIVLDIDIFRADDVPSDEEAIWRVMSELRKAKNQVFEESITEKARELFR